MCGSGRGGGSEGSAHEYNIQMYFKTPFSEKFPNEAIFGAFLQNI